MALAFSPLLGPRQLWGLPSRNGEDLLSNCGPAPGFTSGHIPDYPPRGILLAIPRLGYTHPIRGTASGGLLRRFRRHRDHSPELLGLLLQTKLVSYRGVPFELTRFDQRVSDGESPLREQVGS